MPGALGALAPQAFAAAAQAQGGPPLLMDGHVHIINRVYWEGIDAWQEQPGIGWDYARARKAGVNCVIDNIGTYGAWNYNYSPKQALRLIETAHRFAVKRPDAGHQREPQLVRARSELRDEPRQIRIGWRCVGIGKCARRARRGS